MTGIIGPNGQPLATQKSQDEITKDLTDVAVQKQLADAQNEAAQLRMRQAAAWARNMNRAFKGIRGAPSRKARVMHAIDKYGLAEHLRGN